MMTQSEIAPVLIHEVNKLHGCTVSQLRRALEKDGHQCHGDAITEVLQHLMMQGRIYIDNQNHIQTNSH